MVKRSLSVHSLLVGLNYAGFRGAYLYYSPPFLEHVERASYDAVTRLAVPDIPMDPRILLVEIDQKSLDKMGSWPWPRNLIAQMVHLAKEAEPRSSAQTSLCWMRRKIQQRSER